jgi:hypothetical protein
VAGLVLSLTFLNTKERIMSATICPKCQTEMETGFVIDKGSPRGSVSAPEWADGAPEQSFWFGLSLKGHDRHAVVTYRCPKCAFLESYAPHA